MLNFMYIFSRFIKIITQIRLWFWCEWHVINEYKIALKNIPQISGLFYLNIYNFLYHFLSILYYFYVSWSFSDSIFLLIFFIINYFLTNINFHFISIFIFPDIYFLFMIIFIFSIYLFMLFRNYFFNSKDKYSFGFSLLALNKNFSFLIKNFFYDLHIIFNFSFIFYFIMLCFQLTEFSKFFICYNCVTFFYDLLSIDYLLALIKVILCFFSFFIYNCIYYSKFGNIESKFFFSYGFSVLSLNFLLMSYNFMSFFISLEMFSTSIIILAFLSKSDTAAKDSLLKYFKINSLASVFMLISISLIYGFTGTFSFKLMSTLFLFSLEYYSYLSHLYMCISISILIFSFSFKLILVPFHTWVFDVYKSFQWYIVLYLIVNSKLVFFTLIFYFLNFIFISLNSFIMNLILIISIFTMVISCILVLSQIYIRYFLIAISLLNTGIILFSLTLSFLDNGLSFFLYLIFDNLFFLSFFILISQVHLENSINDKLLKPISFFNLSYLNNSTYKKYVIWFFLSLSGLPPFGIFLLKFNILLTLSFTDNYFSLILFVFISILILVGFIRPLKIIFFSDKNKFGAKYMQQSYNVFYTFNVYPFWFTFIIFFIFYLNLFFFCLFDFFYYYFDSIIFSL